MKKLITSLTLLIAINTLSFGQADKEYYNTLKKMFEISGSEEAYRTVISQMFMIFKQQNPEVGNQIFNDLEKEFLRASIDDLVEMLVPVYGKYLTKDDLEQVILFYQSPVGKKFASNTPLIMQESMQIGQLWGIKIAQQLEQKMRK
jgi:uncharacterized protein